MRFQTSWTMPGGWRRSLEQALYRSLPRSIRARLFITLMIAGAPGVLFGAVEAQRQYQSALAAAEAQHRAAAANAAAQLDTVFLGAKQLLESVSGMAPVRDADRRCAARLGEVQVRHHRYTSVSRYSRTGRLLCSSTPSNTKVNAGNASWFRALRNGADFSASPLTVASAANEPAVVLAAPVRQAGVFAGALTVELRRSWLEAYLSASLGQSPQSAAIIIDERGHVVAKSAGAVLPKRVINTVAAAETEMVSGAVAGIEADQQHAHRVKLAAPGLTLIVSRPVAASAIGAADLGAALARAPSRGRAGLR